jgi:O-antigen/teichoic acid export membrane protein
MVADSMAWLLLAIACADFGVSQALPVRSAQADGRVNLWHRAARMGLLLGCVGAPVAAAAVWVSRGDWAPVAFVAASLPLSLGNTYLCAVLQGASLHGWFNVGRILTGLPYAVALAVLAGTGSADVVLLLQVMVGGSAIVFAVLLWLSRKLLGNRPEPQESDDARPKGLLAFGLKTYPGNIAWNVNQRLAQIALAGSTGMAALGSYVVSFSYAQLVFACASAVALLAPGRIAACPPESRLKASHRFVITGALITIPVAAVFAFVSPWAFSAVFGTRYAGALEFVPALCGLSGLLGMNFVLSGVVRSLDRPHLPSYAELTGAAVLLALLWPMLAQGGIWGAIWAQLASASAVFLVLCTLYLLNARSQ